MIKDKKIKELTKQIREINESSELKSLYSLTSSKVMMELYNELNILLETQQQKMIEDKQVKHNYQQMLSNISHDLKTPLTVMQGMTELIDFEKKTVEENQKLLKKIENKIFEVQKMMHDFFDLSKIEAEDTQLEFQKTDLVEITKRVLLQYYDTLQRMNIELFMEFSDDKIYVNADELAIVRIINNLISNAIKYGSDGNFIGCKVVKKVNKVELSIFDRGKGIEEQFYHQIFERLFTLEDSRNRNYSGSGIGLTITKRLIEKHKGVIVVSSVPFENTEFKVILPLYYS